MLERDVLLTFRNFILLQMKNNLFSTRIWFKSIKFKIFLVYGEKFGFWKGMQTSPLYLLPHWGISWARYSALLTLSFVIYKLGIKILTSQNSYKDQTGQPMSRAQHCASHQRRYSVNCNFSLSFNLTCPSTFLLNILFFFLTYTT